MNDALIMIGQSDIAKMTSHSTGLLEKNITDFLKNLLWD
jgi:hypothetical protein